MANCGGLYCFFVFAYFGVKAKESSGLFLETRTDA